MVKEFVAFLKLYGVIGLAIAVIIGGKFNDLLKAVVDGILMPVVGALTPSGDWRQLTITVANVKLQAANVATPQEAAKIYPASYWTSLIQPQIGRAHV